MRQFTEPSCRNLLKPPLVLGVQATGLMALAFLVLSLTLLAGGGAKANLIAGIFGLLGYFCLRALQRFSIAGWEEAPIFLFEKKLGRRSNPSQWERITDTISPISPDTLTDLDLIQHKEQILDRLKGIMAGDQHLWLLSRNPTGATLSEQKLVQAGRISKDTTLYSFTAKMPTAHLYSLYQLPTTTDPLWISALQANLPGDIQILVGLKGCNPKEIKKRVEHSRRRSSRDSSRISDMDQEVTFEESSQVLKSLSRGEERVIELSLVIASAAPLKLDPEYFHEEKDRLLSVASILGARKRLHRSHFVRAVTASDLIPSLADPKEDGNSVLSTLRGNPLFFSPQDPRLEALHWIIVGASGSGKSFFTGAVLHRMIQAGTPMSVLFIDHNRSFRRIVKSTGGEYFEPQRTDQLDKAATKLFDTLNVPGRMAGIELSDLTLEEKRNGGHLVLARLETFLRFRDSLHPIYVVLDECWNFMRDNPVLVQRAFREFRKLNGAAVAITQSLSDFITDESGQSILQNAPVRILLRQGEDLVRYQGILGLNSKELEWTRLLKQRKGLFSECLIKTPFLSKLGRLYPTHEEYELFRTDNIREELIQESRNSFRRKEGTPCVQSI